MVDHREILNKQCIHIMLIHKGLHDHCINKKTLAIMCHLNRSHVPYLAQNVSPLSLTTISAFPISSEQNVVNDLISCDELSW